ncbi:hypothetical protein [Shewanella maritima]|uniref:hypothetical protein n=1 Tax=Shewanella maritima TaxID=2520507 RepID=UPI00373667D5
MAKKPLTLAALILPMLSSTFVVADETSDIGFNFDIGYDSKYVSEGRNNLEDGGIAWGAASVSQGDFTAYAALGRGTSEHYIEWQFGVEYAPQIHQDFDTVVGYQRLEFYGDERASDNEVFASIVYTGNQWIEPGVHYTYATEAGGYFVEVSLHHHWQVNDALVVSPYAIQGFDFQYATEEYDGANHFQFGVEASYQINDTYAISGHISHSIAQEDIKRENQGSEQSNFDETFAGLYFNFAF